MTGLHSSHRFCDRSNVLPLYALFHATRCCSSSRSPRNRCVLSLFHLGMLLRLDSLIKFKSLWIQYHA